MSDVVPTPVNELEARLSATVAPASTNDMISTKAVLDRLGNSDFEKSLAVALDRNKDGYISTKELVQAAAEASQTKRDLEKQKKRSTFLRKTLMGMGLALAIVILANMGLTYSVVIMAKDTKISANGQMTTTAGASVQVDSVSQMQDKDNRLVSRETGEPVKTASSGKTFHPLTSAVPERYLAELTHFEYEIPGTEPAQAQFVKVNSFVRVPERGALCGSVVRLFTSNGDYTLDDTHLYSAKYEGIDLTATGKFDTERRLDASHGRLLQVNALKGFFSFIEKTDFKCYSTWKNKTEEVEPSPPKFPLAFIAFEDRACFDTQTQTNMCYPRELFDYQVKPGTDGDVVRMQTVKRVLMLEDVHYEVIYYPNHPGQREVRVTPKAGPSLRYQLFEDHPEKLYCNLLEPQNNSFTENVKKDSFLSYLGHTQHTRKGKTSTLRRWRVTLAGEGGTMDPGPAVGKLEMWDHKDTKEMYRFFSDSKRVRDTFYEDFKPGLDDAAVKDWIDTHLNGTHEGVTTTNCKTTTKYVTIEAKFTADRKEYDLRVPPIGGDPFSESYADWYGARYKSGRAAGDDPTSNWWRASYGAYWQKRMLAATAALDRESLQRQIAELQASLNGPVAQTNDTSRRLAAFMPIKVGFSLPPSLASKTGFTVAYNGAFGIDDRLCGAASCSLSMSNYGNPDWASKNGLTVSAGGSCNFDASWCLWSIFSHSTVTGSMHVGVKKEFCDAGKLGAVYAELGMDVSITMEHRNKEFTAGSVVHVFGKAGIAIGPNCACNGNSFAGFNDRSGDVVKWDNFIGRGVNWLNKKITGCSDAASANAEISMVTDLSGIRRGGKMDIEMRVNGFIKVEALSLSHTIDLNIPPIMDRSGNGRHVMGPF